MKYCTTPHEEHLLVGGGNLFLTLLFKTDHLGSVTNGMTIVLAREDVEVHVIAPQTKTEHFDSVYERIVIMKSCIIVRIQHLDHRVPLFT